MSLTDVQTGAAATPTLPAALRLGAVHLTVSDLDRSVAWYQRALGLRVHALDTGTAALGDGHEAVIFLHEDPQARSAGRHAGLYHYDAERHALELVESLDHDAARTLATEFVCGQSYFGSAHVLVLFVARFARSYWKYRRHPKAYASILMDAGHLSQTLYLLAAELGLGAFVTSVINDAAIDKRLGLDGVDEGTVAACGLGVPAGRSPFDPVFESFAPRRP